MLTTRCPSCNTVFRIRAEQLNQRGGRVRCGHCHTPFLALSTLEEMPEDTDLSQPGTPVSAPPAAPATPPMPPAAAIAATPAVAELKRVEEPPVAPEPLAYEKAPSASPPAERTAPDAAHDTDAEAQAFAARTLITEPVANLFDGRIEPSFNENLPPPDFEISLDDEAEPPETGDLRIEPHQPAAHTVPVPAADASEPHSADEESIDITGLEPEFEDTVVPPEKPQPQIVLHGDEATLSNVLQQMSDEDNAMRRENLEPATVFLDDEIKPGKAATRHTGAWWAATCLLLLLALAQASYLFRTELSSRLPALRAPMLELCSTLGCDVPYPTEADAISVEATDLNPDGAQPGRFTLIVSLRNRAAFAQTWPHLELTLTDRFDRAISRRVLTPAEWLPAGMAQSPAFGALGEITAQVSFSSELPAAGYRLYAFYP